MKRPRPSRTKRPQSPGRPKDAAKREGIVRAATTLFMNEGYELTSMEAVAKKADVSKLTIYSHFANKVELFREVIRQRCDKLATSESFMAWAQMPPEPALEKLGNSFVSLVFSSDSIRLQRIMQAEAVRHPEVIKVFYETGPKRVKEAFGDLLKEWMRQGQLSIGNIPKATDQFFSLLKGEMHTKALLLLASRPTDKDMQEHVRATTQLFLAGYRPKTKTGIS